MLPPRCDVICVGASILQLFLRFFFFLLSGVRVLEERFIFFRVFENGFGGRREKGKYTPPPYVLTVFFPLSTFQKVEIFWTRRTRRNTSDLHFSCFSRSCLILFSFLNYIFVLIIAFL